MLESCDSVLVDPSQNNVTVYDIRVVQDPISQFWQHICQEQPQYDLNCVNWALNKYNTIVY